MELLSYAKVQTYITKLSHNSVGFLNIKKAVQFRFNLIFTYLFAFIIIDSNKVRLDIDMYRFA